jgi:O-antigen/teichoic acid export membrane protein
MVVENAAQSWPRALGLRLRRCRTDNRTILSNATSLVGTTVITSGLGYLYWIVAARSFSAAEVGLAAAAVSAMQLLGTLAMLGLGTMLIGELPRFAGREKSLMVASAGVASVAGGVFGLLAALLLGRVSADFRPLAADPWSTTLFSAGVALTAATLVMDYAYVALLRGQVQFARNALFASLKLGILIALGLWAPSGAGLAIFAAWVVANLVSLVSVMARLARGPRARAPERAIAADTRVTIGWASMRALWRVALAHHVLNLALQAPFYLLPLIVTAVLSVSTTAYFYIAWMMASLVFIGANHLTTALYADGVRSPSVFVRKIRFTLGLALLANALVDAVLLVGGGPLLGMFGSTYADQAVWPLRIVALGGIPLVVKDHYVVLARIRRKVGQAAFVAAAGSLFELALALAGAVQSGLLGLSLGWVAAGFIEAILLAPTVYRATRRDSQATFQSELRPKPRALASATSASNDASYVPQPVPSKYW